MYSTFLMCILVSFACTFTCAHEDNSITESAINNDITTEIPSIPLLFLTQNDTESTTPSTTTTMTTTTTTSTTEAPVIGCSCGIYLSGQFKKGSKEQPKGNPALLHEQAETFACTNAGNKMCTNKCLDNIVKHLPNSPSILCASMDRDCFKERAYLFIKNCKNVWINTNLSAGREYCCKDGLPYKCPHL